jgi:hypothetical protein
VFATISMSKRAQGIEMLIWKELSRHISWEFSREGAVSREDIYSQSEIKQ